MALFFGDASVGNRDWRACPRLWILGDRTLGIHTLLLMAYFLMLAGLSTYIPSFCLSKGLTPFLAPLRGRCPYGIVLTATPYFHSLWFLIFSQCKPVVSGGLDAEKGVTLGMIPLNLLHPLYQLL